MLTPDMRNTAARLVAEPGNIKLQQALAAACHAGGTPLADIHALVMAHPDALALRMVAVQVSRELGEFKEREEHLRWFSKNPPNDDMYYVEYGSSLRNNGKFGKAERVMNDGLKRFPQSAELLRLRSTLFAIRGDYQNALDDAIALHKRLPNEYHARLMVGMGKLLLSDMGDGYEEARALRDRTIAEHDLKLTAPEWNGERLQGKTLFIFVNQGIGDTIMYSGFLPWMLAQGARISMGINPKLVPLFQRSFPEINYTSTAKEAEGIANTHDYYMVFSESPKLMLPHYIPAEHPPYLKADAAKAKELRAKYLNGAKRLIGISWHTKNIDAAPRRNVPLDTWQPIFDLPETKIVSLQYGEHNQDIAGRPIIADPTIDAFNDTDALAAQIAACDEVITIDNSTVHLAGALGVKTTLLLGIASEWRWGLTRNDTRWYKSVSIERQKKLGDWQVPLKNIAARLK